MEKNETFALFLMVSTIAGIAILGLPYLFAKTGFISGLICLMLVLSAATLMTIYIAELDLSTKGYHLSGFAKKYLGRNWRYFILLIETLGLYAVLISYLIAIGFSLAELFGGEPVIWGSLFFVIISPLILFGKERYDREGIVLAMLKFFLLAILIMIFLPKINLTNLTEFNAEKIFLPFGLTLYACLGYTTIPILTSLVGKNKIKKTILKGMSIVFFIYLLFSLSFVGYFGKEVNEIAALKIQGIGPFYILIAVSVPFVVLSIAIKQIYVENFGIPKKLSWFLAAFIPFLIYVYFKVGFVSFLQFAGTYMGGILGILTGIMALKLRKTKRKVIFLKGNWHIYYMIAIFVIGIIYQTVLLL